MASPTRDSSPEKPVGPPQTGKLSPLRVVKFISPQEIPGWSLAVTFLETGATRLVDGKDTITPQPMLNHDLRCISILGREIPLERVSYWERAPAAINTAKLTPTPSPDYTVGRRVRPKS